MNKIEGDFLQKTSLGGKVTMKRFIFSLLAVLLIAVSAFSETIVYVNASEICNVYVSNRFVGITPTVVEILDRKIEPVKIESQNSLGSMSEVIHGGLMHNTYQLYFDVRNMKLIKSLINPPLPPLQREPMIIIRDPYPYFQHHSHRIRPRNSIIYREHRGHVGFELNIGRNKNRIRIRRKW